MFGGCTSSDLFDVHHLVSPLVPWTNLNKSQQISTNLNKSQQISTNLNKSQQCQKIGPPHYSGGCLQQLVVFIAVVAMLPDLGACWCKKMIHSVIGWTEAIQNMSRLQISTHTVCVTICQYICHILLLIFQKKYSANMLTSDPKD